MSSTNGTSWASKRLNDAAVDGDEEAYFYNTGKQLWLLVYRDGEFILLMTAAVAQQDSLICAWFVQRGIKTKKQD